MELETLAKEREKEKEAGEALKPKLEVKIGEEAEPDHYSKLHSPSEDVYAEAFFNDSPVKAKEEPRFA